MNRKKILLVDDERDILIVLAEFLTDEGYEVKLAHSGLAALELFRDFKPDLVISDNMMPYMSGIHLLKKFRALPGFESTPFVIMSAAPLGQNDQQSKPTEFLRKPFDADIILKLVQKYT